MDLTPARRAFLMPSVACACAITGRPAALASAISASSSSGRNWACFGLSRGDSTPPEVCTLMTFAPARMISRTRLRISSGPSTRPGGRPACGDMRNVVIPDGSQPSP